MFMPARGLKNRKFKFRAFFAIVLLIAITIALPAFCETERDSFRTVGNIVTFGTYPQTAEGTDQTPIEWIVLEYDAENNRALLLSRYGLDTKPYNEQETKITWEECTLRAWLNGEFLMKAFSTEEQNTILVTDVDNSPEQGYQWYGDYFTNGGNNTRDRIFLLSYAEANKYFGVQWYLDSEKKETNMKSRMAPTAYAVANGASASKSSPTENGEPSGTWWFRSPGNSQEYAVFVRRDGLFDYDVVKGKLISVRPALWIDLESDIFDR